MTNAETLRHFIHERAPAALNKGWVTWALSEVCEADAAGTRLNSEWLEASWNVTGKDCFMGGKLMGANEPNWNPTPSEGNK